MLGDIGIIGGVYTFVRLLLLAFEQVDGETRPPFQIVVLGIAMLVIAFLTVDILLISADSSNSLP